MTKTAALLLSAFMFASLPLGAAEAKGCIKGAIVGGVLGHFAHHGVLGAIGGCLYGRHEANKRHAAPPPRHAPGYWSAGA